MPTSWREGGLRRPNPWLTNSTPPRLPSHPPRRAAISGWRGGPLGGVSGVSWGRVLGAVVGAVVGGVSGLSWGSRAFRPKHFYANTGQRRNTFAKNISTWTWRGDSRVDTGGGAALRAAAGSARGWRGSQSAFRTITWRPYRPVIL